MQDKARDVVECIKLYRTLKKIKEQLHDVLFHKVQQQPRLPLEQLEAQRAGAADGAGQKYKQAPFRLHTNLMQTSTATGMLGMGASLAWIPLRAFPLQSHTQGACRRIVPTCRPSRVHVP